MAKEICPWQLMKKQNVRIKNDFTDDYVPTVDRKHKKATLTTRITRDLLPECLAQ